MDRMMRRAVNPLKPNPVETLALVTLLVLVLGLATLSLAMRQMNASSIRDEHARVAAAMGTKWAAMADALTAALAPEGSGALTTELARHGMDTFDGLARVEPNGATVFLRPLGPDLPEADVRAAVTTLAHALATSPASRSRTIVTAGSRRFAAVALPWRSRSEAADVGKPRTIAVGLVAVDPAFLADLSFAANTRTIRLAEPQSPPGDDDTAIAIDDGSGFQLAWRPEVPGEHLLVEGGTIIIGLASLFAALVMMRAKRFVGEAVAVGEEARKASNHDWLSGLPNRVVFGHTLDSELKQIATTRKTIGLFYLDLDRFKDVNEAFGIETGDLMIQFVTQRIANVVRRNDLIARFEGDSFMILQRDLRDQRDCELLAERVQDALREPFNINGSLITVSASIGIALAPGDAGDRSELIRLANLALGRAKREGRSRVAFYKPILEDDWRRRNSIGTELRQAIDRRSLAVHYQPIVSSVSGEVTGVEALVRWQHPTEGMIAPNDFIGLAEDRGLIIPLGEWVLYQACVDARRLGSLRVAVNVSPIQFRHPGFVASVGRILAETGMEPSRLELELTEGVVVDNEDEASRAMDRLRDMGVRLALDDFGTGYSSLIYLRRFAFDKIKIDRAFIEALEPSGESAILVDSVVRLGRALGLMVTAEGVETAEQLDFLKGIGCPELQGYLISRPMPLAAMCAFLDRAPALPAFGESIRAVA